MLSDMKVLCLSFIDGVSSLFLNGTKPWCILQSMASQIGWNRVASALERYRSGSSLEKYMRSFCCCIILILNSICRRLTISMDLMNFLGFYILYYALKQGVLNCTHLYNQSNRILAWSLLNFILLALPVILICQDHSRS